MQLTFYGVRGSAPTPGPSTVRYGGNTACAEVVLSDGSLLILDAGTGLRALSQARFAGATAAGPPIHLLITHVHWDHILGLPFFQPVWVAGQEIILHALSRRAARRLSLGRLFDGEHFPVRVEDVPARFVLPPFQGESVCIGPAVVRRVALNHPGECDGFRIDDEDGSLCYLTDNELLPPGPPRTTPDELARFAAGAGVVIHDAQYLPEELPLKRGWGHSSVADVLRLGQRAACERLVLFHHDPDRDDDALDRIGAEAAGWLRANAPATEGLVAAEGLSLVVGGRAR